MVGGTEGEPGLADILARMKADWDVVVGPCQPNRFRVMHS